jgi:hypothetical protein
MRTVRPAARFHAVRAPRIDRRGAMIWPILFLILVIIIFALGFTVHVLLWLALALFVVWIILMIIGRRRGGWYW